MEILIWLGFGLFALYGWLIGHWFARIVMALVFVPGVLTIGGTIGSHLTEGNPLAIIIGAGLGAVGGWYAASAPIHYWRAKTRKYARATAARAGSAGVSFPAAYS